MTSKFVTKIKSKKKIDSDNPNAPYGEFVCEYVLKDITLATWDKDIFDVFNTGVEVEVQISGYREDQYGIHGRVDKMGFVNKEEEDKEYTELCPGNEEDTEEEYDDTIAVGDGSIIILDGRKFRLEEI